MAVFNQQILVEFSRVGVGSAVSVIIFVLIGLFVFLYMKFLNTAEA
jgi:ABC-type sugar transport system permease subunit